MKKGGERFFWLNKQWLEYEMVGPMCEQHVNKQDASQEEANKAWSTMLDHPSPAPSEQNIHLCYNNPLWMCGASVR